MDKEVTTIHITETLTSSLIISLMDEYPNLKEITCSKSVYNRTSDDYIDALETLDITVRVKYNWGAKDQSNGLEFEVSKLAGEGFTAKEISEKLDITLNRVYYLAGKAGIKFSNMKRKHGHDDVIALKRDGLSAKEISQKLDIPIRSVYYILNKK